MRTSESPGWRRCSPWFLAEILTLAGFIFPLFSLVPWQEPYIEGRFVLFAVGTAILSFVIGVFLIFRDVRMFSISLLGGLLLSLGGYLAIAGLVMENSRQVLIGFGILVVLLPLLFSPLDRRAFFTWIRQVAVFGLLIYSGWTLAAHRFPGLPDVFGHPHFLGAFILLWFPLLLSPRAGTRGLQAFVSLLAVILSLLTVILLSRSRVLGILVVTNLLAATPFYRLVRTRLLAWGTALFILAGGIFLSLPGRTLDTSLLDRFTLWGNCFHSLPDIPFWGVGSNRFEVFYQGVLYERLLAYPGQFMAGRSISVEWAHNEFIQVYVEWGIPGFALVLGLTTLVGMKLWQFWKKRDERFLAYLGLGNLIIYALVSFPFHMPNSAACVWILLAFLAGEDRDATGRILCWRLGGRGNFLLLEVFFLAAVLANVMSFRLLMGHVFFSRAIRPGTQMLDVVALERSRYWWDQSELLLFALGKAHLDLGDPMRAEYFFRRVVDRNASLAALYGLAVARDLLGKNEAARDLYLKIRRIDPAFSPAHHNLRVLEKRMNLAAPSSADFTGNRSINHLNILTDGASGMPTQTGTIPLENARSGLTEPPEMENEK